MDTAPNAARRPLLAALAGLLLTLAAGCSATGVSQATWVEHEGGVLSDARAQRARAAVDHLCAHGLPTGKVDVQVLNTDTISACAWPNRRIFVTRGLIDLLSDNELAAALAHEIGHLLDDGHLRSMAALRGVGESGDHEVQADTLGCGLLKAAGVPQQAMISMLEKVRAVHAHDPYLSDGLEQRIARLRAQLDP